MFDLFSGSTGLTAIPDVLIAMTRQPTDNVAYLIAACRGIDEELDIAIVGDPKTLSWTYRGNGEEARVSDIGDQVLEILKKHGALTPTEISRHMGRNDDARGNIGKVLQGLIQRGLVAKVTGTRGKYQVVPDGQDLPF